MYRNLCRLTDSYRPELFLYFVCIMQSYPWYISWPTVVYVSAEGGSEKWWNIHPRKFFFLFYIARSLSFFVYYAVLFLSLIYVMVNNSLCQCWGGVVKSGGIYTPVGFSSYFMHDLFWYVWLNFQSFNHSLNIWFDLGVFKSVAGYVNCLVIVIRFSENPGDFKYIVYWAR